MGDLRILQLSDGRPGHYHLAEGVIEAFRRIGPVSCRKLDIARRKPIPARLLRKGLGSPFGRSGVLRVGYGIDPRTLPAADLVVSAGGETLPANVAAARLLGAENIFCGSLRGVAPESFSLVVTSYERHASLPRHLVTLKPSAMDPEALGRPRDVPRFGGERPPATIGLLIGGNSGLFSYRDEEWHRLFAVMTETTRAWGSRWLVSTSRRTADWVADHLAGMANETGIVSRFVDFRSAGPGTLPEIFAAADMIVCTQDSSTMISEAVSARLPVIGIAPAAHDFKPEEREYRQYMLANNWCRFLNLSDLTTERLGHLLGEITPLARNPLDDLAVELKRRLPGLFSDGAGAARDVGTGSTPPAIP